MPFMPTNQPANQTNFPKRIYRVASPLEIESLLGKVRDEVNAIAVGQYKVQEWKLPMVIIDSEYQWDRRKLTFYFSVTLPQYYPNQHAPRIDFRTLVRDLYQIYRTRIWMYCVDKDHKSVGGGRVTMNRQHNREKFLKQLQKDAQAFAPHRAPLASLDVNVPSVASDFEQHDASSASVNQQDWELPESVLHHPRMSSHQQQQQNPASAAGTVQNGMDEVTASLSSMKMNEWYPPPYYQPSSNPHHQPNLFRNAHHHQHASSGSATYLGNGASAHATTSSAGSTSTEYWSAPRRASFSSQGSQYDYPSLSSAGSTHSGATPFYNGHGGAQAYHQAQYHHHPHHGHHASSMKTQEEKSSAVPSS